MHSGSLDGNNLVNRSSGYQVESKAAVTHQSSIDCHNGPYANSGCTNKDPGPRVEEQSGVSSTDRHPGTCHLRATQSYDKGKKHSAYNETFSAETERDNRDIRYDSIGDGMGYSRRATVKGTQVDKIKLNFRR